MPQQHFWTNHFKFKVNKQQHTYKNKKGEEKISIRTKANWPIEMTEAGKFLRFEGTYDPETMKIELWIKNISRPLKQIVKEKREIEDSNENNPS